MTLTEEQREGIATVLDTVAKVGMPDPWDMDTALDAIEAVFREAPPEKIEARTEDYMEWCAVCRRASMIHCSTPDVCGNMVDYVPVHMLERTPIMACFLEGETFFTPGHDVDEAKSCFGEETVVTKGYFVEAAK